MKTYILVLAILGMGHIAHAQQGPVFSLGASTLGATLEASYRVGPNFGIRGIAGYGRANLSADYNGAPLTATATIGGYGLLADVYFGGGARLTAGAIAPNYGANLAISGDLTLSGTTFNNVNITGTMGTLNQIAPMLSIGYEKVFVNNWGVSADIGATYTGGLTLSATDNNAQIPQADIESELATINAELGQVTILPFVKFGVSFAF